MKKQYIIGIIGLSIFVGFGCSKKEEKSAFEKYQPLPSVKQDVLLKRRHETQVLGAMEVKEYKSRYKELGVSIKVSPGFSVHEDKGSKNDYFVLHMIEMLKQRIYPASVSLTHYPAFEGQSYDLLLYYNKELIRLKKLNDVEIIKQGEEDVLGVLGNYVILTYQTIFPIDQQPLNFVNIKEKIVFFKYNEKIYKLKFSALEDKYESKKAHYKNFVETVVLSRES